MEARRRIDELVDVVSAAVGEEARGWLSRVMPREGFARAVFYGAYAGAGRRFGAAVALSDGDLARLRAVGVVVPEVWSLADLARAALLMGALAGLPESEHVGLVTEVFRKGDSAERVALLRALSLLPGPERFAELAAEACRNQVADVLAALACDNPFPARYLPELIFNQLVMKALFSGLALDRILDWRSRNNAELLRMARDYASERRAAGRPISSDLALLTNLELRP